MKDYAGVALLIALFVSNALALDLLYNKKAKLTGVMNIISLCLTVALAYTFNQTKNIMIVFGIFLAIVALFVILRFVIKRQIKVRKKAKADALDHQENEGEKNENY
jgi:phosphotransferase system  glucose/maltose/N-acetylglucosamine-specific IIC component